MKKAIVSFIVFYQSKAVKIKNRKKANLQLLTMLERKALLTWKYFIGLRRKEKKMSKKWGQRQLKTHLSHWLYEFRTLTFARNYLNQKCKEKVQKII